MTLKKQNKKRRLVSCSRNIKKIQRCVLQSISQTIWEILWAALFLQLLCVWGAKTSYHSSRNWLWPWLEEKIYFALATGECSRVRIFIFCKTVKLSYQSISWFYPPEHTLYDQWRLCSLTSKKHFILKNQLRTKDSHWHPAVHCKIVTFKCFMSNSLRCTLVLSVTKHG